MTAGVKVQATVTQHGTAMRREIDGCKNVILKTVITKDNESQMHMLTYM